MALVLLAGGGLALAWSKAASSKLTYEEDMHAPRSQCSSFGNGALYVDPWHERSHESSYVAGSTLKDVFNLQHARNKERQLEHPGVALGMAAVAR